MSTFLKGLYAGLAVLGLLTMNAPLHAHPGHGGPISKESAVKRASSEVDRLISAGKLDPSWRTNATLSTAELRNNGKNKEWAIIFSNTQVPKESERTLYVFLSDTGEYLAANFTGK